MKEMLHLQMYHVYCNYSVKSNVHATFRTICHEHYGPGVHKPPLTKQICNLSLPTVSNNDTNSTTEILYDFSKMSKSVLGLFSIRSECPLNHLPCQDLGVTCALEPCTQFNSHESFLTAFETHKK